MKWAVINSEDSDDRNIHVIPLFGEDHVLTTECWCGPRIDRDNERLDIIIHEASQ